MGPAAELAMVAVEVLWYADYIDRVDSEGYSNNSCLLEAPRRNAEAYQMLHVNPIERVAGLRPWRSEGQVGCAESVCRVESGWQIECDRRDKTQK